MLPDRLERVMGARYMQSQDAQLREDLKVCPPVSPQFITHLKLMFQDPSKSAKPNNPQLAQLLTIQYGCDKVINYLENHYNAQSEQARKDHEI